MRKPRQAGLVVEGNSTRSAVLKLPALIAEIGPIKATSLRVARYLSNSLRAGYPVETYEGLEPAQTIFIRVPDEALPRVVTDLASAELPFAHLTFVLCETWLGTDYLRPLAERQSHVATLMPITSGKRNWFVVEGQLAATKQVKRIVEASQTRALELRSGAKYLFFAASILAGALPIPPLVAAQHLMRAAGITGRQLEMVMDELVQSMFRRVAKGARAPWGGPLDETSSQLADAYLAQLRTTHRDIWQMIDQQSASGADARRKFQRAMARPAKPGATAETGVADQRFHG